MTAIQIFDPALCCSSGVCGIEVDQALVNFSADIDWAVKNGAQVERFNLAQQPLAFADNPVVKGFLQRSGAEALPLILVDGEVALAGRYPLRAELARWAGIAAPDAEAKPAAGAADGDPAISRQSAAVPVLHRQGRDLRRAGIAPWAWIVNHSLVAARPQSPLLRRRALANWRRSRWWQSTRSAGAAAGRGTERGGAPAGAYACCAA